MMMGRLVIGWVMVAGFMLAVTAAPVPSREGGVITLEQAVSLALEYSPELKQAAGQARYAAFAVEKSKDAFLPVVSGDASFSQRSAKNFSQPRREYGNLGATIDSRVNLFRGFADRAALEENRQNLASNMETRDRKEQTVVFDTVSAYLDAVLKQERIGVAEQNLAQHSLLLEQIKAFVAAGTRPVTDLFQQQAEMEDSRFNLLDARKAFNVSKMRLLETMGTPGEVRFAVRVPDAALFFADLDEEKFPAPAYGDRADLRAQEHRILAADRKIVRARAGLLPVVDLFLTAGSAYSGLDRGSVMEQMEAFSAGIGISVAVPIFDRHLTRHNLAQSGITREIEVLELERRRNRVRTEVGEAVENYRTTLAQERVAKARLAHAAKALESVEQRYMVGAATLTELTRARATHVEASYGALGANINRMIQAAALEYARGRGFQP
ncbi:MAG: TolC family protein [Desulfobacteraceae bacterium]|nr:TolC family protein [Desulfobacteraceae bacterium]